MSEQSAFDEHKFLLIDELKVMGYGESDTSGAWVKFQLEPEVLDLFRGRKGEIMRVAIQLIDNQGEVVPASAPKPSERVGHVQSPTSAGRFWHRLISSGFFHAPDVLRAIGPERDFEEWIRKQPSCVAGAYDWDDERGEIRNECAHVRRISEGAGTAEKPPYFAVPMTHAEHREQHQKGEDAVLSKDAYQKAAGRYRTEWASTELANVIDPDRPGVSRAEIPPSAVLQWAEDNGLTKFIPETLRGWQDDE